jgi:hypothetical protein
MNESDKESMKDIPFPESLPLAICARARRRFQSGTVSRSAASAHKESFDSKPPTVSILANPETGLPSGILERNRKVIGKKRFRCKNYT